MMQLPSGLAVVAALPDPGCLCFGGIAYWPTLSTLFVRPSEGDAVSSDEVLVSAQVMIWLDV